MSQKAYVRSFVIILSLLLAGCGGRAGTEVFSVANDPIPEGGKVVAIYSAMTRQKQEKHSDAFIARRSAQTNYARCELSVPPAHKAGEIEWPEDNLDLKSSFAVVGQQDISEAAFFSRDEGENGSTGAWFVRSRLKCELPEAAYHLAQMTVDAGIEAKPLLFS